MSDDTEEMAPRESELEQRIAAIDGEDATGDYVAATRAEFSTDLMKLLAGVAAGACRGEADITARLRPDAERSFQRYFQSMKGQVGFTPDDLHSFIDRETERQQDFYRALRTLVDRFSSEKAKLKALEPGDVRQDICWQTGIVSGAGLTTETGAYLYACPLVPASSAEYMALRQEPVAADILAINPDMILFLPTGQDTGDRFMDAYSRIYLGRQDVSGDFPDAWNACLMNGYLLIDSAGQVTPQEVVELKAKYEVAAVVAVNSSQFQAKIHTGGNDRLLFPEDLPEVVANRLE